MPKTNIFQRFHIWSLALHKYSITHTHELTWHISIPETKFCIDDTISTIKMYTNLNPISISLFHCFYLFPFLNTCIDHCHTERTNEIDKRARKKLIIASILCVIFMIVEIIGGVLSNSLAIATDAAHLLADLAAFMISLFALWVAARPSTKR